MPDPDLIRKMTHLILKKLTKLISLKHNLFIPHMKVIEKTRINGKVKKRYQIDMPEEIKEKYKNLKDKIDMIKLTKAIVYLKEKLGKIYQNKNEKCIIEI